jgi:hypothetical protein
MYISLGGQIARLPPSKEAAAPTGKLEYTEH